MPDALRLVILLFQIFMAVIVVGTSIWVFIDARKLGMKGGQGGFFSGGPAAWLIVCLLVWIVAFPFYLIARAQFVKERKAAARKAAAPVAPAPMR